MKVVEILKVASNYLNIYDDLSIYFEENADPQTLNVSEDVKKKFDTLMLALNNTINELALTKFQIKETYVLLGSKGHTSIKLESLTGNKINKVLRVYDENLEDIVFAEVGETIIFNSHGKKVFIDYTIIPPKLELNDEIKAFYNVGTRIIALGVASEYLNLCEIYDDAERLAGYYTDGLSNTMQQGTTIKTKRWI